MTTHECNNAVVPDRSSQEFWLGKEKATSVTIVEAELLILESHL